MVNCFQYHHTSGSSNICPMWANNSFTLLGGHKKGTINRNHLLNGGIN